MDDSFQRLSTEQFRIKMRPHAIAIYNTIFHGSRLEDLREQGVRVHILDKTFGIDTLWNLPSGQSFTLQEKYRANQFLVNRRLQEDPPQPDFTQEYKNAVGTQFEAEGEWFRLAAQLYFYGWANATSDGFARWVLIDVAKYKALVEQAGGLNNVGVLKQNKAHGAATFYAIPINRLQPAIIYDRMASDIPAVRTEPRACSRQLPLNL